MDNPGEIMRLCRLCLVKDQVNIPIFDEQGDIRQIFLKISSCLPVKVSREDPLPKSICDGCSNKLDLLYEFRNTSANAEKTLLSWVGQADAKDVDETVTAAAHQVAKPSETQVKQEEVEESNPAPVQDIESMDAQESATFDESSAKDEEEEEPPPPKRARRTAAVKAQINIAPDSDDEDDDDDDLDGAEPMTKIEDESEESDDDKDPSYQDVPGTSADDQPGPSGVGKDGVEAPPAQFSTLIKIEYDEKFSTLIKIEPEEKPPPIQCPHCSQTFQQNYKLKSHLSCHQKEKSLTCNVCSRQFKKTSALYRHMRNIHEGAQKFTCEDCGHEFNSKNNYHVHRKRHLQDFIVHCYHCGEGFVTKAEYRRHLDIKHIGKKFVCDTCGKSISNERHLKDHQKTHEENYRDVYYKECRICNKKFLHLKRHFRKFHEGMRIKSSPDDS